MFYRLNPSFDEYKQLNIVTRKAEAYKLIKYNGWI